MVAIAPIGPFTPVAQLDPLQLRTTRTLQTQTNTEAAAFRLPVDTVELGTQPLQNTQADFLPRVTLALNLGAATGTTLQSEAQSALLDFAIQAPDVATLQTGVQAAVAPTTQTTGAPTAAATTAATGTAPQQIAAPATAPLLQNSPPQNAAEITDQQSAGAAILGGELRATMAPLEDLYARGEGSNLLSRDFIDGIEELIAAVEIQENRISDRVRLTQDFREVMDLMRNPPPSAAFQPGTVPTELAVRSYQTA